MLRECLPVLLQRVIMFLLNVHSKVLTAINEKADAAVNVLVPKCRFMLHDCEIDE